MKKQFLTVRDMTYCAIGASLLSVCAWISVPVLEIAFTMQTFGVFLILGALGGRRGSVSILVYLLLGAVGLPVFSGFRGGLGVLAGVTGGYIWGFLAAGLIYWLITALAHNTLWSRIVGMVAGMVVCYACGTVWFTYIYAGDTPMTLWAVAMKCVVPYLIPDGIKLILAFLLSIKLEKVLNKSAKS